jgi:hypothetical protein
MLNIAKNARGRGFIRVLQINHNTGTTTVWDSKPNMILYTGANLMAKAIAGEPNAKITHMYVGFTNNNDTPSTVTLDNTDPINQYTGTKGYLRLPLAYTPSFLTSDVNHDENIPVFSASVANPISNGGAAFETGVSKMFEIALVSEQSSTDASQDIVFSRAQFTPLLYNNLYAVTLQWGIEFIAAA